MCVSGAICQQLRTICDHNRRVQLLTACLLLRCVIPLLPFASAREQVPLWGHELGY